MPAEDPYRYFRVEAREILDRLRHDLLALDKESSRSDSLTRIRRDAHTLKGAARVVRVPQIAQIAHAIEDLLAPFLDGAAAVPAEKVSAMLRDTDAIEAELNRLDNPAPPAGAPEPAPSASAPLAPAESFERVRVEVAEMEALEQIVAEASAYLERTSAAIEAAREVERSLAALAARSIAHGKRESADGHTGDQALREEMEALRESLGRSRYAVSAPLEAAMREFGRLRETVEWMRLLPVAVLFSAMERCARDAAESIGKRVEFHASGGANRLDRRVISALGEALLHLVRNAVAHGIEAPADRAAAGKPAAGRITLSAEQRADRIVFACTDDGRGIDFEAVRRAVVQRGLDGENAASLSDDRLIDLLFRGGISTAPAATEIAGRGIGLEVVKQVTAGLKGRVTMRTERGRGTTVELEVPLSLSSIRALLVETAGVGAWIPIEAVRSTMRISSSDVISSADRRSIVYGAGTIPFVSMASILGYKAQIGASRGVSAVIVEAQAGLAAAGVDRIVITGNAVVHPLPASIAGVPLVSGAALDPRGNARLVLDPNAIVEAALGAHERPPESTRARPRILAIDDSLTSRMLEKSILEGAGCEVDLAASGEEALSKALTRPYALLVCDIEMPGMDGFEFLARAREHEQLRAVPAIMVTTRTGAADRARAAALGAQAYIAKNEFDEKLLLGIVTRLVA